MTRPLLFLVPRIGAASEMFVATHLNELAPDRRCSVIAREVLANPYWSPDPPVTDLGARGLAPYQSRRYRMAKRAMPKALTAPPPRVDPATVSAVDAALSEAPDTAVLAEYLDAWSGVLLEVSLDDRPVVVRSHGYDVSVRLRNRRWIERYKRLAERVTIATCSDYSRDLLVDAGVPGGRIITVANGVDPEVFTPTSRRLRAVDEPFRVLSVGRLVAKKDPRPTLESIRRLRDIGIDATLTLAGDGGLRSRVEGRISELGLSPHVSLLGSITHDHVIDLLGSADAFVQHSVTTSHGDEEGMPMSVLEAMASGLAVVGTRHAGIPEAIDDCGYIIDPGDTEGLYDSLRAIADDPKGAHDLGCRGRRRIIENYSWDRERTGLRELLDLD
ncbi:MAG: glycosyltransferase family 4 protein [Acidimicrobiales bacterium]